MLLCPHCGTTLQKTNNAYSCENGHCFDIAKSGYVNLYLNAGHGRHGDDKAMVRARTDFLNKGFYQSLADKLIEKATLLSPSVLVDAGCGEGYYTSQLAQALPQTHIIGFDLSKDALNISAKRMKSAEFAVASTAKMPLGSNDIDLVLNVFSPYFYEEFARVLKPGGYLLRVIPLEKHLHELRQVVYDKPYDNEVPDLTTPGFQLVDREDLCYTISLDNQEDIEHLFLMTPYYYKTGRSDQEKLTRLNNLNLSIQFGILTYKKT